MSVLRCNQRLRDRARKPNRHRRSGSVPVDERVRVNLLNMCRLCMTTNDMLVDVFVLNGLTDIVFKCFNVIITETDEQSKMLCLRCFNFAMRWQHQREDIEKNQQTQTMLTDILKERADEPDLHVYLVPPNRYIIAPK